MRAHPGAEAVRALTLDSGRLICSLGHVVLGSDYRHDSDRSQRSAATVWPQWPATRRGRALTGRQVRACTRLMAADRPENQRRDLPRVRRAAPRVAVAGSVSRGRNCELGDPACAWSQSDNPLLLL
jgi:hypothetical protein